MKPTRLPKLPRGYAVVRCRTPWRKRWNNFREDLADALIRVAKLIAGF